MHRRDSNIEYQKVRVVLIDVDLIVGQTGTPYTSSTIFSTSMYGTGRAYLANAHIWFLFLITELAVE